MMIEDEARGGEVRWVATLVLLAFCIRWIPAFFPHFWFDEVYTIAMIHGSPPDILKATIQDSHPPLYYYWVKVFAAAGRRLGGPFATLAWLRLASILPGTAACLLGWWAARRGWGPRASLAALALFAVWPALTYYSVELRNYSTIHGLMLLALIGLLEAAAPQARHPRRGVLLFALSMILAFYVHSLSTFYLVTFGLIFLAEAALRPAERPGLLRRGAAAGAIIAACCLPWIPFMSGQTNGLNNARWLGWAGWKQLPFTFLFYLPLGPWDWTVEALTWPWLAMAGTGAGLAALAGAAWRRRAVGMRDGVAPDRLLVYSAVMVVIPLLCTFILSHYHIAKVFLGYRYNLIPAPFFILAVVGLALRVERPRLRRWILGGMVAGCAMLTAGLFWQRITTQNEVGLMATYLDPEIGNPENRVLWNNPIGLPWLERSGSIPLGSAETVLEKPESAAGVRDCYFLSHLVTTYYLPFASYRTALLEHILERHKAARLDLTQFWSWARGWRLSARELPALAADYRDAIRNVENRRFGIPGGQVLLADDPAFKKGQGWGYIEVDGNGLPQCWTEGPRQTLAWAGPEKPGRYRLTLRFWRARPFPENVCIVRYRLPGQGEWKSQQAEVGHVTIEGEAQVGEPRQRLRLELEIPTWTPAKVEPGSKDYRELGMIFTALEIRPAE